MALRSVTRQLLIAGTTALKLDSLHASHDERSARRHLGNIVRVFYVHGTPASHAATFHRQLALLRERFNVITFETLKALFNHSLVVDDPRPAAMLRSSERSGKNAAR